MILFVDGNQDILYFYKMKNNIKYMKWTVLDIIRSSSMILLYLKIKTKSRAQLRKENQKSKMKNCNRSRYYCENYWVSLFMNTYQITLKSGTRRNT